jgi:hypothetical protein
MKLNPVLEVEASVIDKEGKHVPLAGQVFYISERDPIEILKANDLTSEIGYARTMNALRNFAARFLVTDSRGKTGTTELRSGTYHICGIRYSEHEAEVWNVEIELLPGKNHLVFNEGNMTT